MTLGRSGPGQGINISLLSYLHSGEFSEICDIAPVLDVAEIPDAKPPRACFLEVT